MSKSLAELREDLVSSQGQLEQVRELLRDDPKNEELVSLEADLKEAVALAIQIIREKEQDEAKKFSTPGKSSRITTSVIGSFVPMAGMKCMAPYGKDGTLYPAIIQSVMPHMQTCEVLFIGFGKETKEVAVVSLEPWVPFDLSSVKVGKTCQAVWDKDGAWYDASITGIDRAMRAEDSVFRVTFLGFDESALVDGYHIRPRPPRSDKDGGPKVPKILPTDPESVVKRKKRRIKQIAHEEQVQKRDEERQQEVSSWAAFTSKVGKKHIRGTMKGLRKGSIFKSPEGIKGRVGVTGSDKPMTMQESRGRERFDWISETPDAD